MNIFETHTKTVVFYGNVCFIGFFYWAGFFCMGFNVLAPIGDCLIVRNAIYLIINIRRVLHNTSASLERKRLMINDERYQLKKEKEHVYELRKEKEQIYELRAEKEQWMLKTEEERKKERLNLDLGPPIVSLPVKSETDILFIPVKLAGESVKYQPIILTEKQIEKLKSGIGALPYPPTEEERHQMSNHEINKQRKKRKKKKKKKPETLPPSSSSSSDEHHMSESEEEKEDEELKKPPIQQQQQQPQQVIVTVQQPQIPQQQATPQVMMVPMYSNMMVQPVQQPQPQPVQKKKKQQDEVLLKVDDHPSSSSDDDQVLFQSDLLPSNEAEKPVRVSSSDGGGGDGSSSSSSSDISGVDGVDDLNAEIDMDELMGQIDDSDDD